MIWSFHWSPMVSLQLPPGTLVNLKFPLASHLVNMKSSASGSPRLTQHWVQVERIAGAAGVEPLVGRPAQALDIHLPLDGVGAGADGAVGAGCRRRL